MVSDVPVLRVTAPSVADVDGDGTPDLIVMFAAATTVKDPVRGAQRWVEAISGRSGKSLWRRELDDAWFALGVQWHPASLTASGLDIQLFRALVDACQKMPARKSTRRQRRSVAA